MRPFADVLANLAKFAKKAYRDGYLETTVRGGVAFQIRALRNKFGDSQEDFARRTGKKQSVVSRLEDPELGKASVQTLIDIAKASDVALVVRFVSYPEFLAQMADMSPDGLKPDTVFESLSRAAAQNPALRSIIRPNPQDQQPSNWLAGNLHERPDLASLFKRDEDQKPKPIAMVH